MIELIKTIEQQVISAITELDSLRSFEEAKQKFLGKKSELSQLSGKMRDLSIEEKKEVGALLNQTRRSVESALDNKYQEIQAIEDAKILNAVDRTLPARLPRTGAVHPISIIRHRAMEALKTLGFVIAEGPEIETEFYCFDALNTPEDHPARNEKDTFYFDSGELLRTHTSSVQIRTMQSQSVPLRIMSPGSAYRRDEIDATHLCVFNQLEGLYVAESVGLADLKGVLEAFFMHLFGDDTELRFRPHFFPFTEPSFEIDIKLKVAGKEEKWIEVAGCGLVDPAVFDSVAKLRGDDTFSSDKVSGFAFGMGLDRLAMIEWGIADIRDLITGDVRFLQQFA